MEATQEKNNEKIQAANKWLIDANATTMDIFNKQISLVLNFYIHLFNSFPGMNKKEWMANLDTTKLYGNEILGLMSPAFKLFKINDHSLNLSSAQSEESYKQMLELQTLCSLKLQKHFQSMQTNWNELDKELHDFFEKEWKSTNNLINSVMEVYNKQMAFSTDTNEKFKDEVNELFNEASEQNKKFTSNVLKSTQDVVQAESNHEQHHTSKKHTKAQPVHTHAHNQSHHKKN